MSEEWEEQPRPQKRRLPKWLVGTCGCGCLAVLVALVALLVLIWRTTKDSGDPEVQWPRLAEVLPYGSERPDLSLESGIRLPFGIGMEQYQLQDQTTGASGRIYVLGRADMTEQFLDPHTGGPDWMHEGQPLDPEPLQVSLRGHDLRGLTFRAIRGQEDLGGGLRVDLGQLGGNWIVVEVLRPGEPAGVEELKAFLGPFELWGR